MIHSEMAQSYFLWWSPHLECGHLWKRHVPASSSKAQRKEWKECSVPTVNTLSSWNRHPLNSSPRGDAIWLRSVSPWIPRVTESPWDPVYVHYTYSNNAPGQPTIENNGSTLYYYPHFIYLFWFPSERIAVSSCPQPSRSENAGNQSLHHFEKEMVDRDERRRSLQSQSSRNFDLIFQIWDKTDKNNVTYNS